MKTSCVTWGKETALVLIREEAVKICKGDACSAALISFFEYWHNHRMESSSKSQQANAVAEKHGEDGAQDTSLFQFHTMEQLKKGLMGIGKEDKIRNGIKFLEELKIISIHKNPNPRYKFDATKHFLFHPDVLQNLLDGKENDRFPENRGSESENTERESENTERESENRDAISEITNEITKESLPPTPKGELIEIKTLPTSLFEEEVPMKSTDTEAEEIYQLYRRKVNKPSALKAIKRALKKTTAEVLKKKVIEFMETQKDVEMRFIPHPSTWFNREGWTEDPESWGRASTKASGFHQQARTEPYGPCDTYGIQYKDEKTGKPYWIKKGVRYESREAMDEAEMEPITPEQQEMLKNLEKRLKI